MWIRWIRWIRIRICNTPITKKNHLTRRDLLDLDLEAEAAKQGTNEVLWAVFAAFIK
jgi:hypothetical protein